MASPLPETRSSSAGDTCTGYHGELSDGSSPIPSSADGSSIPNRQAIRPVADPVDAVTRRKLTLRWMGKMPR